MPAGHTATFAFHASCVFGDTRVCLDLLALCQCVLFLCCTVGDPAKAVVGVCFEVVNRHCVVPFRGKSQLTSGMCVDWRKDPPGPHSQQAILGLSEICTFQAFVVTGAFDVPQQIVDDVARMLVCLCAAANLVHGCVLPPIWCTNLKLAASLAIAYV